MPQPCSEHASKPQVSCETCFPDDELRISIERMRAARPPSAPSGQTRKRPKRLDESERPSKKRSWRDDVFGGDL